MNPSQVVVFALDRLLQLSGHLLQFLLGLSLRCVRRHNLRLEVLHQLSLVALCRAHGVQPQFMLLAGEARLLLLLLVQLLVLGLLQGKLPLKETKTVQSFAYELMKTRLEQKITRLEKSEKQSQKKHVAREFLQPDRSVV